MRVNYAIIFVSDMDRSVAFYRDVIGLQLKFESPGWTEFATDGATLALHTSHERAEDDTDRDSDSMPAGRCYKRPISTSSTKGCWRTTCRAFRARPTCSAAASQNTVIPTVWQFQSAKAATASGRAWMLPVRRTRNSRSNYGESLSRSCPCCRGSLPIS